MKVILQRVKKAKVTIAIIIYEIGLVTLLAPIFKQGVCVLLAIVIGEVTFGALYYVLLRHLLKKSRDDIAHNVHHHA